MSYNVTLQCGCLVYIACDPLTSVAHARILERRDPACRVRKHAVGLRLSLFEIVTDLGEIESGPKPRSASGAETVREAVTGTAPGLRREAR